MMLFHFDVKHKMLEVFGMVNQGVLFMEEFN